MQIILCGYHWTGCKALELLLEAGHEVFVYTHKTENCIADLEGLCIRKKVRYTLDKITADRLPFIPDMICSVYFRQIIKKDVIDAVGGRIFNLHPSLLPRYRGCSSLTWAMVNGEEECGFTYHYIDPGCDTGNIILQRKVKIEDFDTQLTLYNRVMFQSMEHFLDAVRLVEAGYPGKKQEGEATVYKRGCPMNGEIEDTMDFAMKERFVRAMCYPPYPAARYQGEEIRSFQELLKKCEGGGKIIVFGCGGHARSIINTLCEVCEREMILLVDEQAGRWERILRCETRASYVPQAGDGYIIGLGDNEKRSRLYQHLRQCSAADCLSVVSLQASVGMEAKTGRGTYVAPGAYIGPEAEIGADTIVNTASVIEHETVVGDHTHIAPHATICGRSKIGSHVFLGAGATVIDGITVCDRVIIGAGAVVKENITEPGTYVGVPVRRI